ncbi:MAG: class I SAM-dependent methyltransferase, partial [Actinomycetia bacterium]|nr:class I SAM-dependent methyltransferase [Actinomycetes bacterium]
PSNAEMIEERRAIAAMLIEFEGVGNVEKLIAYQEQQASVVELLSAKVRLLTEQLVSSGAAVDALDTSPAMREVVRAKIEAQHWSAVELAGHLEDLHPQRRYDLIVCSSVCSFLPDYPGEVERLVGGLRPGGVFVQWDWERTAGGDSGLSRDEVRETLRRACLTDVHVGTAFEIAMGGQPARPLIGWGQKAP